jgi:DNA invertase Pin-like site-specific DNA recombinase
LCEIVDRLQAKGVALRILNMNLDTNDATGKLMLQIIGSIAEFERSIMLSRQLEGIAKAKAEGKYRGGIPTARAKAAQVFALVDAGSHREMSRLLPNRSLIRQMTNIMLPFQVQHN